MNFIKYILIILIIFAAPLKWFFNVPFRINYYEILIVIFLYIFFISSSYEDWQNYRIQRELKLYLLFIWGWFFLAGISGVGILFYSQGADAYSFYLKGLLQLFIYSVFFTLFIFYLFSITTEKRCMLISCFVLVVVISSVYGIAQLILKVLYGIDVDDNISRLLGQRIAVDEYLNLSRYEYGYLTRINGITGDPSVHAAYALTALPLLLLGYIINRNNKCFLYVILFLIVFISLILTMSGSGTIGFVFSILVILLLRARFSKLSHIILSLILFAIVCSFYSYYKADIIHYAKIRFDPNGTISSHGDIAIKSMEIGMKYPLGVGYNNFSIAYENHYGVAGYNPHNNWLGYFVQTGFIGLFYKIIFSIFIIICSLKRKTLLSCAFVASYIGMCIAANGYQTLDLFSMQLFTSLFFTNVMLENKKYFLINYKH